jgi:glycosyltransferase involved in cell wall biosynthesis/O-antigen/teichoic acid export membrane protein
MTRASDSDPLQLVHITTVPMTMRFFVGQISFLKDHGFTVRAISSPDEDDSLAAFGADEDIEVHAVPMEKRIAPASDIVSLVRLCRLLRKLRPDVVHSHTPKAALLGTLAARLAGVPVVVISIHGLPQMTRTGFTRKVLDAMTRLGCRVADKVWCVSPSMRSYVIEQHLCHADKVVVLGSGSVNGVDSAKTFSPDEQSCHCRAIREQMQIPPQNLVIGFVGRITADKGMHELAQAWRQLSAERADVDLLLVGPFEAEDPLLAEDAALFHEDKRVHLAGPQKEVAPFFAAMDVFVMPSYREGFGVTNIEAASMSLPVVSTCIPGCVDSVQDGVTGTLVPPRDSDSLHAALDEYCSNPAMRREHGQAGRQRVIAEFEPRAIWQLLSDLYRGIANQPRSRFLPRLRRRATRWIPAGGLGRASALVLSSSVATRAVGFVAAIIGAAALGPRQFGEFAFSATTAALIVATGVLGFSPLTMKRIADAETASAARDVGRLVVTVTFLLLSLLGVGYWLIFGTLSQRLHWDSAMSATDAGIVSLWAVAIGVTQILGAVLSGHRKFAALANLTLLRGVLVGAGVSATAFLTHSASSTIVAAALSEATACAIALVFTSMGGRLRGSARAGWNHNGWSLVRGAVGSGLANLMIQLAMWASMVLLLRTPAGYIENGGFSVANRLTLVVTFLPSALAASSLPFLSGRLSLEMRSRRVRRMLRISAGWVIFSASAVAVSAPLLLSLLGSSYRQFTVTVIIMSGTAVAMAANVILGYLAVASGRVPRWIVSDLILAATLFAVSWATVGHWGANGMAAAYLIACVLSAATLLPMLALAKADNGVQEHYEPARP